MVLNDKVFIFGTKGAARMIFGVAFFVLIVIGVIHVSAIEYSLYFYYNWLDIPVHFLGGIWVSATALWLILSKEYFSSLRTNRRLLLLTLFSSALFIGLLWEAFEYVFGIAVLNPANYVPDTIKDLFTDVLGSLFLYVYYVRTFGIPLYQVKDLSEQ